MKSPFDRTITFARVPNFDAAIAAAAHADVHVLTAQGDLGEAEIRGLCDEMVSLSCADKSRVVLDLSRVTHIEYQQIPSLAARARLLKSAGGDLKLCGLSTYLSAIFRASGQMDRFDVHEDAPSAASAFAIEG